MLGLGLTGFILMPLFGVPPAFGNLLEIGFEGGHGTVGGMTAAFESFGWQDGIALGYTMATAGMIIAIMVGMILVNWAYRKKYVKQVVAFENKRVLERLGVYRRRHRPTAGSQTVLCDSIDSLAWHLALIGISIFFGYVILTILQRGEVLLFPGFTKRLFNGFPLFPLCMIGGLFVQHILRYFRISFLVDHGQMQRISGASLDFLVVAAIATIRIEVVISNWQPLLVLIVTGTLLSVFMVMFVAPKLFKDAWFERAIADFGQSLGVTATGLLLLRTVDPETKTPAAEAFGYKQLFHEPFMGGGLITALLLTFVFTLGWKIVFLGSLVMCVIWGGLIVWQIMVNRRQKE